MPQAGAPAALLEQLSIGGILIIPMGADKASQFIFRITRTEEGYDYEQLMPVRFVPLLPNVARNNEPVVQQPAPSPVREEDEDVFFSAGAALQTA